MVDLLGSCLSIEFSLVKVKQVKSENRESNEAAKCDECAEDSKQKNVAYVVEELLSIHIEASCEDDRRQDEIEEEIVIESHDMRKFFRSKVHIQG